MCNNCKHCTCGKHKHDENNQPKNQLTPVVSDGVNNSPIETVGDFMECLSKYPPDAVVTNPYPYVFGVYTNEDKTQYLNGKQNQDPEVIDMSLIDNNPLAPKPPIGMNEYNNSDPVEDITVRAVKALTKVARKTADAVADAVYHGIMNTGEVYLKYGFESTEYILEVIDDKNNRN